MSVFYNSSQDDETLLNNIFDDELDRRLDLVVDDASHLYEQTRKSFEILFPLLQPGGTYVIEDWAWSHRVNAQNRRHPWWKKSALTNLIFEMVVELAGGDQIESIYINNNHVRIKKSLSSGASAVLSELALRGKKIKPI